MGRQSRLRRVRRLAPVPMSWADWLRTFVDVLTRAPIAGPRDARRIVRRQREHFSIAALDAAHRSAGYPE